MDSTLLWSDPTGTLGGDARVSLGLTPEFVGLLVWPGDLRSLLSWLRG